ncbi:MAG: nucleoside hydrolase, partial [Aerococcus viridans]
DIFTEIHHANLVIETKGEYTYGQTVIDFDGATGRSKNVVVAMDIDLLTYKEYVMATLFGEEICDLYLDYLG